MCLGSRSNSVQQHVFSWPCPGSALTLTQQLVTQWWGIKGLPERAGANCRSCRAPPLSAHAPHDTLCWEAWGLQKPDVISYYLLAFFFLFSSPPPPVVRSSWFSASSETVSAVNLLTARVPCARGWSLPAWLCSLSYHQAPAYVMRQETRLWLWWCLHSTNIPTSEMCPVPTA